MPKEKFKATELRESLTPPLRMREMARRMNISQTYLAELESNRFSDDWPEHRIKSFLREIELWKKNPDLKPRKIWGRKHGLRADGSPAKPKGCTCAAAAR